MIWCIPKSSANCKLTILPSGFSETRPLWLEGEFQMKVLEPERLVLEAQGLKLSLLGKQLQVSQLSADSLRVSGVLLRLDWEELP